MMTDELNSSADLFQQRVEKQWREQNPEDLSLLSLADAQKLIHELYVRQAELEIKNEEMRLAMVDITERKVAEKNRRESDARLRYHVQHSPLAVIEWDNNFIVTRWAGEAERMFGWSAEETVGKPITDLRMIYEEDIPIVEGVIKQLSDGVTLQVVSANRNYSKDRHILHCEWFNSVLPDSNGNMASVLSLVLDLTVRKQAEEAQLFLLQCGYSDEDFFASLARYLAESLSMDYVCIDKLLGDTLTAQTVAVYFDGNFEDNVEYALKDTPCGDVVGKSICCFPKDVRHLFPRDAVLQEMAAESYVGTTLWSSHGRPIGLIAVLSRRPLRNPRLVESILKLVAIRAAGELERRQAEEKLKERTYQLEEANKELESFCYSVSHDLRAPLRAIDGYTRMILREQGDKFDENVRQKFAVIRNNAKMMGQLIDDLLALSRLGVRELSVSPLNVGDLIRDVWEELKTIYPDRHRNLKMDTVPPGIGDRALIKQVFVNLLANAIKFTRTREVPLIEVGGYREEQSNVYYVRDNGVGFDMQYYEKLFGVFQRLHSADNYEGTGVGLAIVLRIVQRHGGRVWAVSKVGEGACFYFTLPPTQMTNITSG